MSQASWSAPCVDIGPYIGRFRVIRPLGAGGMAAIYECLDERLQRRVAIKVLHRELAYVAEWRNRLFGECLLANMLPHPAFVAVQEDGELPDGRRYLVMELLHGETLAQFLARSSRLPDRTELAVRIGKQVAAAMVFAHERGVIHRDLKPENLFLVDDAEVSGGKRVRILDFGIADSCVLAPLGMQPRRALGTPGYMAPEQILSAHELDGSADVYALGVLLYEILTGARPFARERQEDELRAQLFGQVPVMPSSVPPRLRVLLSRMLMLQRAYRPRMSEVQAELLAIATSSFSETGIHPLRPRPLRRWKQVGAAMLVLVTLLLLTLELIARTETPSQCDTAVVSQRSAAHAQARTAPVRHARRPTM